MKSVCNRKIIMISCIAVAIMIAGGCFALSVISARVSVPDTNATLHYVCNGENIRVDLTAEESEAIRDIFDGKRRYNDDPSCGFSEDISVRYGDITFCVARDTCPVIKCGDRYFKISNEDREALNAVFAKYGGSFPCV